MRLAILRFLFLVIVVSISIVTAALLHVIAVHFSALNPVNSAVSELHDNQALIHTIALTFCSVAQWAWPAHLLKLRSAWLARFIFYLARLNAILILLLVVVFHIDSATLHTAWLSVIASLVTICMAGSFFLWWQMRKQQLTSPSLITGVKSLVVIMVHLVSFVVMTLLVLIGLSLDVNYVGVYQRTVGSVFLLWLLFSICLGNYRDNR